MELLDLKKQGINTKEQIPLSRYTFTKTGGEAEYLAFRKSTDEVEKLVKVTLENKIT